MYFFFLEIIFEVKRGCENCKCVLNVIHISCKSYSYIVYWVINKLLMATDIYI